MFLHGSLNMWCLFVVFCVLSGTIVDFVTGQLDSPCPNVFQYARDENKDLYGRIRLDNPRGSNVVLDVQLSVGNQVENFNGHIELAYDKAKAVDEIVSGRPLYYKVFFPIWRVFPPRITKIMVNGELICSGRPLDIERVPVLTTISLQHTLKINNLNLALAPDAAGSFDDNDNHQQFGSDNSNYHSNNINGHQASPDKNENGWFVQFGAPDAFNQYGRNPFLSSVPSGKPQNANTNGNTYNNNPFLSIPIDSQAHPFFNYITSSSTTQKPREPIDFQGNPFFSHITTTTTTEKPREPVTQKPVRINTTPSPEELPELDIRGSLNEVCGKSLSTTSLIAYGTPVTEGYYPWVVALYNINQLNLVFTCGGTLVSTKHVITAAHCLKPYEKKVNIDQLLLILGKYNIQRWTNDRDSLMLSAEKVSVHPDYRALSADADIAVITLTQTVRFKSFIRPICLWSDSTNLKEIVGDVGVVAGWGKDENGQTVSPQLKQVRLPIVSQAECLNSHDDFQGITSDRTFCAGYRNGSGPCNGDSGGGFMMHRNGRWTLRGVVSTAIADQSRNCDLNQYLVFTDVSKFSDWILAIINK